MAFNDTDASLLHRWQHLHLLSQSNTCHPSKRADSLRSLLAEVEYARAASRLSSDASADVFLTAADKYASLVDSPEEQGESKLWSSSLSEENLSEFSCVQNYLEDAQAALGTIVPPGKQNASIYLGPRHNHGNQSLASRVPGQFGETLQTNQVPLFRPHASSGAQNQPPGGRPGAFTGQLDQSHLKEDDRNVKNFDQDQRGYVGGRGTQLFATRGQTNHRNSSRSEAAKRPFPATEMEEDVEEGTGAGGAIGCFKTARQQLAIDNQKKFGRNNGGNNGNQVPTSSYGTNKRSLGTRRGLNSRFVPPVMSRDEAEEGGTLTKKGECNQAGSSGKSGSAEEVTDKRLKNIEPKMVELIMSEIMDHGPAVCWEDIAGLQFAKKTIQEIVVWPMLRPDIFTGLRGPPKGLLLFGPPGTGKTLIGKCIASQSKSTFFSISASSLTSKWVGEGEKMVRALFAVARVHQPAVIFIDEIDSLLSQRSDGEHEASRRIKTEFLVQLDGAGTGEDDRILVVGATNRPQEIDEAARRRFVKRLYIPLPEAAARQQIVVHLMSQQKNELSQPDIDFICQNSEGYSGADMANLCREAALGPIRSISFTEIESISAEQVRPILRADFDSALKQVRASVSSKDLDVYLEWNKMYGSWSL